MVRERGDRGAARVCYGMHKYDDTFAALARLPRIVHIAEQVLCSGVYECDGAVEPISCSGEPENATYFGLNRVRFGSEQGYAEFLFTISEYDFVFREGQLQETSRFADHNNGA